MIAHIDNPVPEVGLEVMVRLCFAGCVDTYTGVVVSEATDCCNLPGFTLDVDGHRLPCHRSSVDWVQVLGNR